MNMDLRCESWRGLRAALVAAAMAAAGCSRAPAAVGGQVAGAPTAAGPPALARPHTRPRSMADAPPVAVVELFTSEGCSSCPPADRNLARIVRAAQRSGRRVYALSFHIDYWNSLGWRDPFSSGRYSARQRRYAERLGHGQVYTPEMIVNGAAAFVGSDDARADAAIRRALGRRARAQVALSVAPGAAGTLRVRYLARAADRSAVLDLALVERTASSRVTRGENAGRTLVHANVVRAFKRSPFSRQVRGSWRPAVPDHLGPRALAVIGYVQDATSLRVLGAAAASPSLSGR